MIRGKSVPCERSCGRTDREMDVKDKANSRLSLFCWQFKKNKLENLKTGSKIFKAALVSGQNTYTQFIGRHTCFVFWDTRLQFSLWRSAILNFVWVFSFIIHCNFITISFLAPPSVNHPVFLSDFNELLILYWYFRKILTVDFPHFANAKKKGCTFTECLRKFWPSYGQLTWCHSTICWL